MVSSSSSSLLILLPRTSKYINPRTWSLSAKARKSSQRCQSPKRQHSEFRQFEEFAEVEYHTKRMSFTHSAEAPDSWTSISLSWGKSVNRQPNFHHRDATVEKQLTTDFLAHIPISQVSWKSSGYEKLAFSIGVRRRKVCTSRCYKHKLGTRCVSV